jgi:hypothetical protein
MASVIPAAAGLIRGAVPTRFEIAGGHHAPRGEAAGQITGAALPIDGGWTSQ